MPVYSFKCAPCAIVGDILRDTHDTTAPPCPNPDCQLPMTRVFTSFGFKRSMPAHFNVTTGRYTSNAREHADNLKRMSEERSARLGLEHTFVPVDPADAREVYGVTDEGLDEQARRHRDLGWTERKQTWL